jgi:hypothetical protein
MGARRRGSVAWTAAVAVVFAVLAAAVAVRAIRGQAPVAPEDRTREPDAIRAPMQLLGRGASLRIAELDPRTDASRRDEWKWARRTVFELAGCPPLSQWLDGPDGQRLERALGELRRGSREEALGALALVIELGRRTEWDPGLLARSQHAQRLAALLQDWLRAWGERGADDPTLSEPTAAAVAAFAHVMQVAVDAPAIGSDEVAYERARAFLASLLLDAQGQPTALSRALRARHPGAVEEFESRSDVLAGFEAAAAQLFPELDGECE